MFEKVLASFGVGSAQIDARLEKSTYRQGETILGDIFVQGGKTEQDIDSIYMYLILQNLLDKHQDDYVIDKFLLSDSFSIGLGETKVIPFQFQLPYDIPVTSGGSAIYLKTALDVKMAIDPSDRDGIEVLPSLLIDQILQAVEQIGFQLNNIEFDYEMFHARHPFVQKYRFIPRRKYAEMIDEMNLVFYPSPHEVDMIVQVNNRARDLKSSVEEVLQMDERIVRFTISDQDSDLLSLIENQIQQCISD